jgi:hypothetical protein
MAGFLIQAGGYSGHSIGQNFGAITQFGKIQSDGFWAQAGFDFMQHWGVYGFWGMDDPKDHDALKTSASARVKNQMYSGMLRFKAGAYSLGLEYMQDKLETGAAHTRTHGDQVALSALYNF